jgi:type I restriction-modification system DNA methylase subunit
MKMENNVVSVGNKVWSFANALRGNVGVYDFPYKAVELFFLKAVVDDSAEYQGLDIEDMRVLMRFQQEYSSFNITSETLVSVLHSIGTKVIGESEVLSKSIKAYDFLLKAPTQRELLLPLQNLDFPKSTVERKAIIHAVLANAAFGGLRNGADNSSPDSIVKLASSILQVTDQDDYVDPFAGFSTSLFDISHFKSYTGYEINIQNCLISQMMLLICRIPNAKILAADSLVDSKEKTADKLFSQPPFGLRLFGHQLPENSDLPKTNDVDVLSFYQAYSLLKDRGVAVLVGMSKILFSTANVYLELRKKFTAEGLKAIVCLPGGLSPSASVPLNLFVLEKGYRGPIRMIDAQKIALTNSDSKFVKSITDEGLNKIIESYQSSKPIDGFCLDLKREDIAEREAVTWNPARYFEIVVQTKHRPVSEIDKDIETTMAEIMKNAK